LTQPRRLVGLVAAGLLFLVLATANAGGYRYGVSDQAFYIPAIAIRQQPDRFPHDRDLLAPQMHLWLGADLFAGLAAFDHGALPRVFFAVYLLTLIILFAGAVGLARGLGAGGPGAMLFVLLLTLRHRIPRTGANTLEGYMHPRMLAFAIGTVALAAIVRDRRRTAVLLLLIAAIVHPTTAAWFVVVFVGALIRRGWSRRSTRVVTIAGAVLAMAAAVVGVSSGLLVRMDPAWLSVFADRDYLFPTEWPLSAWLLNLLDLAVVVMLYRLRVRQERTVPAERDLVAGAVALAIVFLAAVPFTAARVALAVQLQPDRAFWVLDLLAVCYLAVTIGSALRTRPLRLSLAIVGLVGAIAAGRGVYLLRTAHRPLVAIDLPASPWTDAMRWLRTQPVSGEVLADPNHVWLYGSSVRVAALRGVVLDESKDPALAIYDRTAAGRVADRARALDGFDTLSSADLRRLARRYDADVLVEPRGPHFDFPVLYSNDAFVLYDVR
jgi:hypothetical protein